MSFVSTPSGKGREGNGEEEEGSVLGVQVDSPFQMALLMSVLIKGPESPGLWDFPARKSEDENISWHQPSFSWLVFKV